MGNRGYPTRAKLAQLYVEVLLQAMALYHSQLRRSLRLAAARDGGPK